MPVKRPLRKLTDIDPRELSLVDLAANKHRYLIAKRRDPVQPEAPEPVTEAPAEAAPTPEPAPPATPVAPANPNEASLHKAIDALNAAVDAIKHAPNQGGANEDAEVTLQKRLIRLEKHFGLPTSQGPDPQLSGGTPHVWPFDINRASEEL